MTLDQIRLELRNVAVRTRPVPPIRETLAALKLAAVAAEDQAAAKDFWCLERAFDAQEHYLGAWELMRAAQYYSAWCDLEQVELCLTFLKPHADERAWQAYRLDFIEDYVIKWQRLFPYKMFMSPELLEIEKLCTICERPVSLRRHCGHRIGEIYNGEMCCRKVAKVEILGLSFVDKPVQKYSVVFPVDATTGQRVDSYNYSVVEYAANALQGPFDGWDAEWTTRRRAHAFFAHVGRNAPCPCGADAKYKHCCLRESGVKHPHLQFHFHVDPAPGTARDLFVQGGRAIDVQRQQLST